MWHSLRARLWLTYAALVVFVLIIVGLGLVFYLLRNPALDRQTVQRLEAVSAVLMARLRQENDLPRNPTQWGIVIQRAANTLNVRIVLVKPDGSVLADSHQEDRPALNIPKRLLGRTTGLVRDTMGRGWLFVSRELPQNGGWLWILAERPSRLKVVQALFADEFLSLFTRTALLALGLAFLLAYAITRWVTAPLQEITASAQALADGEMRSVPITGPSEVQSLGRAFNAMSQQVQASRQSQQDFVANVSHDLKTPLTAVRGFAQALLDGTADTPETRHQAAQVIYDEAGRMYRMVMDLLELARFDAGTAKLQIAPFDMAHLLRRLLEHFSPLAEEKDIHLEFVQKGETPFIFGDEDRLARVFTNLIENAVRHTPGEGTVTVVLGNEGRTVRVRVEDTGPGIPAEALPHIFERFYQVDTSRSGRQERGSGLGLSIAYEIVQAHGGKMSAANRPEGGAVFTVRLPLKAPVNPAAPRGDHPSTP